MRVATAVIADAANARDGLLNVLGGGINQLIRESYPASFAADLALLLEVDEYETRNGGSVVIRISAATAEGEQYLGLEGEFGWESMEAFSAYVPVPVDLRTVMVPSPGMHVLTIDIGGVEVVSIQFVAKLANAL